MIRRFNYTGRRKIGSENVSILLSRATPAMSFEAHLTGLDKMGLPGSAQIFIEAYHQATYMRFDYGTVAQLRIPQDRILHSFYDGAPVNFRVKIVDSSSEAGRILATADRLRPGRKDDDKTNPLIPVRMVGGMGQEIWRIVWDESGPVLELNQEQAGIKDILLKKHIFRSMILPEILRNVLTRVLKDKLDQDDEFGEKPKLWLKFVSTFHPEREPEERESAIIDSWVNRAVQAFCQRHHFFDAWKNAQLPTETTQ